MRNGILRNERPRSGKPSYFTCACAQTCPLNTPERSSSISRITVAADQQLKGAGPMPSTKICVSILCACGILALLAVGAPAYGAEVSPGEFNDLKETVRQQGELMRKMAQQLDQLQKAHAVDQQTHQKDQEMIQQLQ